MLVLMLPADESQNVQTIAAIGQAVEPHPAGIVMLLVIPTGRVGAFLAFARYKERPLEGLNGFACVPRQAWL